MIDFRSDTVTKPSAQMMSAINSAPVGDDVYGDDPTVNQLEHMSAAMLGKQAAIFAPSGTQTNLLALMSHCDRGDEYLVGQLAHTYKYEAGGAAVLGSIQPQPIEMNVSGEIDLELAATYIKPDDIHFARTKLFCLENTTMGRVLSLDYINAAGQFCKQKKLAFHLDGARVFNAAVKLGADVIDIVKPFDSVSICLSKGLGAPIGSVLVGSHELINKARRHRKMLGGAMRQAGLIAAAGIYALENNISDLALDHDNAQYLANELAQFDDLMVTYDPAIYTNMVYVQSKSGQFQSIADALLQHDIKISPSKNTRFVLHRDISHDNIDSLITQLKHYYHQVKSNA